MKNLILSIFCALILFSCDTYEDEYIEVNLFPEYSWQSAVDSSTNAFVSRYWNLTHHCFNNTFDGEVQWNDYWPEAHGLDVLVDAYVRTGNAEYKDVIYDFYDGVRAKNYYSDNWEGNFYDDMGWHCLAHMRALEATNDDRYAQSSKDLWKWITEGWSDYEGGGIQWRIGSDDLGDSKGIPANGPACIIAARRSQKYPDEVVNGFTDFEWAQRIYEWIKYNRTVLSTGRVYEEYDNSNGDYSYDVGTFIGAALEMYKITNEKVYLNDAIKAADYHISSNINSNNRVMRDYGEQAGDGRGHDVNLFKGIFVRYFTQLIQNPDLPEMDRNRYVRFLENNANYLWTYGTQKSPVIKFSYTWWLTPEEDVVWGDLRSAISAATTIEAMALLEKDGYLN
ncbi:glycoside hydrolase family 76 protein [Plebeiibacterium sediminum]|uniref:Alpha-1,6-mannanase n=1 Tax=Plebeiibacterium sediminum TaxID=2992112 RepID=A0AAE3SIQ4_9BACT|nr:glycoside hydrolase family 76 protein [Plebeiobacterium sediminum]MCW3789483.1 alpha-1,6-mannanase [Plebeiobacterium sediminum]